MTTLEKTPTDVGIKYNSAVFFLSLTFVLRIKDTTTRIKLKKIYGKLIDTILEMPSYESKVTLFKLLMPIIKSTIPYLKSSSTRGYKGIPEVILLQISDFSAYLVKESTAVGRTYAVSQTIFNQVFVDDLVCDIGDCVIKFKKSRKLSQKRTILAHIKVLLADYNFITKQQLTPRDLFDGNRLNRNAL